MGLIDTAPVKGTRDFHPDELRLRRWLFDHFRAVSLQFGYEEWDSCVLESESLYIRKAGDEITAQLYGFEDKGSRRVALRPELTPSLARMVLSRGKALPLPARWFAIGQCFRYERMQKGRKREHYQWNMDVVGLASVAAEVELMAAQAELLRRLGFDPATDVEFRVSHRGVLEHFLAAEGIAGEQFAAVCVIVDKHDKIGREATAEQLAGLGLDSRRCGRLLDLLAVRGLDGLAAAVGDDNPGLAQLRELLALASSAGIGDCLRVDCSVVRGLSYYTGTVWELFAAAGGLKRAIAGGGRYDRLLETFGGEPTAMVGFGFGDVVILELLRERGALPALDDGIDAVVAPLDAAHFNAATALATALRAAGERVVVDYSGRRFKHLVKRAEEIGASRLCVIGSDEAARGVYKERSLGGERHERELPLP